MILNRKQTDKGDQWIDWEEGRKGGREELHCISIFTSEAWPRSGYNTKQHCNPALPWPCWLNCCLFSVGWPTSSTSPTSPEYCWPQPYKTVNHCSCCLVPGLAPEMITIIHHKGKQKIFQAPLFSG